MINIIWSLIKFRPYKGEKVMKKDKVEQIHSEIISKISIMLPCNPNLHQAVSNEILQALHKYLD